MAYDEQLAERAREELQADPAFSQRKMFAGIYLMLHGNMCAGVIGDRLMLRLGDEGAEKALREPDVFQMDFTGRPMRGMVYVDQDGLHGAELARWVARAAAYARSLPPKG